jgi:hypothetical protein
VDQQSEDLQQFLLNYIEVTRQMPKSPKWIFACLQDMVLQHGIWYEARRKPAGIIWGEWQMCFRNAFRLVDENPELTYVEGYALGVLSVHHAWAITPDGKVIDNTWRDRGKSSIPLKERAYIGIPLKMGYVRRIVDETGTFGALDAWELDWPLLTGEHRLDEVMEVKHGEESKTASASA